MPLPSSKMLRFCVAVGAELALLGTLNLFDEWTLESMPVKFVATAIACGIAYFVAVSQFPAFSKQRHQVLVFWLVAVALRLLALPLAPGDDLWRYQWEGRIQHAGSNPYVLAPDAPELEPERLSFAAWSRINHREWTAIYPPGAELIFRGLSGISDNPLLYKLLFAMADLGTVALLVKLIGGADAYERTAWYAWNPLVAYTFAGAAHFDSLMILPMVGGVLFLARYGAATERRQQWLYAVGAAILFGLAISIKLVPVFLLLPALFALGLRAVALPLSLVIPAGASLFYGYPKIDIWHSLGSFANVSRLNDLFWWAVEDTYWPNPHQKNYHYNLILLVVVVVVSSLFYRNWRRGMLWAMGTALILSPVLHPWYCTWILPFAAWRRSDGWQVLSITLFAYYLFWNERLFALPWHAEPWMRALIICPPLLATVLFTLRPKSAIDPNDSGSTAVR